MKTAIASVLSVLLTLILFVPVGLTLQWALPIDIGFLDKVLFALLVTPIAVVARMLLRAARKKTRSEFASQMVRVGAFCLFGFFALAQIFIWVPRISRRVGPWVELRALLAQKSIEIEAAAIELGFPVDRNLTWEEARRVEAIVSPEEFVFPLINKTVRVKMVGSHAGIDYGDGRQAIFDLRSMRVIYKD